ncbi:MAG: hypothetical protein L6R39_000574 [Caloplaca ligustica]|nr:MAG: hypothetical protein L6R39_000574 [Caloplaca ligustica]
MDHLPHIPCPEFDIDEVPFTVVNSYDYEKIDLAYFPLLNGYTWARGIGKYSRENYELRTMEENSIHSSGSRKASFIQAWLFFGPLGHIFRVLQIPFVSSDFLYERSGQCFLTLKPLERYALMWRNIDRDTRERHRAPTYEIIRMIEVIAHENLYRGQRYQNPWSLSPEQSLSIQLLHEALRDLWGSIYQLGIFDVASGAGLKSDLPKQRMETALWCPSEIAMAQHQFSVTGRYFASRLKRLRPIGDHGRCTETKCYASQVDNHTYVTQHTCEGCPCEHVTVDAEKVGSIVEKGEIPRFHLEDNCDGTIGLNVSDSGPFVAFSHVWADGLGNARANSLPQCQLQRLGKYTEGLSRTLGSNLEHAPLHLWIDTLGVPLARERRKMALKSLPRAYEKSTCCLVLDSVLLHLPVSVSIEELCMRLVFSTWSRRLWTFQEGVLTWDRLFFQLHSGPTQLLELHNKQQGESILHSSLRLQCLEEAKRRLPRVSDFQSAPSSLIGTLTEACRYRTTSRTSDEIFCLASVAGLPVEEIIQASTHEEKMRIFLLQIRQIPRGIIFFPGPKLRLDNFTWAPASFLYPVASQGIFGDFADDMGSYATCLPSGLRGNWPAFRLTFSTAATLSSMDLYYFCYADFWVVLHSIDLMQQKIHGYKPDDLNMALWKEIHKIERPGLLVGSLEPFQTIGLIVSMSAEEGMVARPVLRVDATLVPVNEGDVFNPEGKVRIEGSRVKEDCVWTLI